MASSPVFWPPTASRWWNRNSPAISDLPHPERGTIHCPGHGHLLPCEPCAVRGREAGTAGWVIGLLGEVVTMLEEYDG